MVGDEYAYVFVFQLSYDTLYVFHSDRVDAGERFIEEYEFRVDGEGSCYLSPASFTAGELNALAFMQPLIDEGFKIQIRG